MTHELTDAECNVILGDQYRALSERESSNIHIVNCPEWWERSLIRAAYAAGAASVAVPREPTQAVMSVLAERGRQQSQEGWNTTHDDDHDSGELALAAACYAESATGRHKAIAPAKWPWDRKWWKPKNARRDLVKAGALILAEIERLDRANDAAPTARDKRESK